MCGIAGIHVRDRYINELPLESFADMLLLGIEHRGRDATGLVAFTTDNEVSLVKDDIPASQFIYLRPYLPADTQTILMHTRLATQGPKEKNENNHPVVWKTCYGTHNGVVSNDDEVFEKLNQERTAEVDSQAIFASLFENGMDSPENIEEGLTQVVGSMAIAACDPDRHPGQLLLARGESSPLWVLNHPKAIIWASTKFAIRDAWKAVMGTCTEKENFNFKNQWDSPGFYEFFPGEFWIVKNGKIEQHRYSPPFRTRTYTYGGHTDWNEWDRQQTNIRRYSINGKSQDRVKCDGCNIWFDEYQLTEARWRGTETEVWYVCEECSEDESWSYLITRAQNTREAPSCDVSTTPTVGWVQIQDFEEELHRETCKLVGEEMLHTAEWVNWILFVCTLDRLRELELEDLRQMADDLYYEVIQQLREEKEAERESQFRAAVDGGEEADDRILRNIDGLGNFLH